MKNKLKLIFFGSSEFALKNLKALLEAGYSILAVVTQPDKKSGRHLRLTSTPVNIYARQQGLEVLCPCDLLKSEFLEQLAVLKANLFVVASYGKILPAKLLSIPGLFALNIHASLLPAYRGAAPIQRAILAGETVTGITIIRMNERMDEGDIINQASITIEPDDNGLSLEQRLACLANAQILQTLKLIAAEKVTFTKQDSSKASLASKLTKADGLIDWKRDVKTIHNQVRGCFPWPVAFTYLHGKRVKIFTAQIILKLDSKVAPGQIVKLEGGLIYAATGEGILALKELQAENGKRISAAEFISGIRLKAGESFGI